MHKFRHYKEGFTLAEVLVTLAIIGVVAALTIPTLIQSTNNSKFTTALKKNLSILSEVQQTRTTQDSIPVSSLTATANQAGDDALADYFAANLNVIGNDGFGGLTLADGTFIQFRMSNGFSTVGCQDTTPADSICDNDVANQGPPDVRLLPAGLTGAACPNITPGATISSGANCYLIVDVNGSKNPNTYATTATANDVYILGIGQNTVLPVNAAAGLADTSIGPNGSTWTVSAATAPTDASIKALTQ